MDEQSEKTLRAASEIRRRRSWSWGLAVLYCCGMLGAMILLPWQALLVVVPVCGALIIMDLRESAAAVKVADEAVSEVLWKMHRTITLGALQRYAITEFTLDGPWSPEAVLAMAGRTGTTPPTASVRIGSDRRVTATVFYDPETSRTSLIGSDTASHDLLDLVRRS